MPNYHVTTSLRVVRFDSLKTVSWHSMQAFLSDRLQEFTVGDYIKLGDALPALRIQKIANDLTKPVETYWLYCDGWLEELPHMTEEFVATLNSTFDKISPPLQVAQLVKEEKP